MFPSPTRMFLTKGVGVHRHALTPFEFALRDADIEQQNLVYVSSILPRRCEVVAREAGVELLRPGDITFCVLARSETNEFGRHVYASLGLARPADPDMYGYISELHGYGMTAEASVNRLRISPRPCWPRHSAWILIPRPRGTSANRYTNTAA